MSAAGALIEDVIPQAWLPGESLFSLCSRHHSLSGNHRASSTCRQLFGHPSQGSAHDLPGHIGHFVEVTRGELGDAETIVRRHTVLPFYFPFAASVSQADVVASMTGTSIGSLKYRLGLLTSRFRANHPLKACLACMASDRAQWGTGYWHVEHQLPGVWVCPLHGELLASSNLKATGVGRFQWVLPTTSHLKCPEAVIDAKASLSGLARLACSLWSLPSNTRFEPAHVASAYRIGLRQMGLVRGMGNGRLVHAAIGKQYAEFIHPLRQIEELRALPACAETAAREVSRLTYEPRSGVHPLRHLALIGWLFGDLDSFIGNLGKAARPPPSIDRNLNVPQDDSGKAQQQAALLTLVAGGLSVTAASRQLGVDPHTGMAWLTRRGVVTSKRPSLLKEQVRAKLISALRRGAAKCEVASMGAVSIQSVTRLLRTEVGLREQWQAACRSEAQRHARKTWIKLITTNPQSGVKAARMLRPEIYAWLYRNDRDWLVSQSQALINVRHQAGTRVDWDERDRELAKKVAEVCVGLATEVTGKRLKLWQIYQKLPDLKAKLGNLDKLPLTHLAIKSALSAEKADRRQCELSIGE